MPARDLSLLLPSNLAGCEEINRIQKRETKKRRNETESNNTQLPTYRTYLLQSAETKLRARRSDGVS